MSYFEINGDVCYISVPTSVSGIYERRVVITKEAFIACYNSWILGRDSSSTIEEKGEDYDSSRRTLP